MHRFVAAIAILLAGLTSGADGHTLVGAGFSPALVVWDLDNNTSPFALRATGPNATSQQGVRSMLHHPDGTLLVGQLNGDISIWDIAQKRVTAVLRDPLRRPVGCLALLHSGEVLVSGCNGDSILLWNMTSRLLGRSLNIKGVQQMTAHPDDASILAGRVFGDVLTINVLSREVVANKINGTHAGPVKALAVVSNDLIASSSSDGVFLRRLGDAMPTRVLSQSTACLATLPDGRLATGSEDGYVRIWQVNATGRHLSALLQNGGAVHSLTPVGDSYLASAGLSEDIKVWEVLPAVRAHLRLKVRGDVQHLRSLPVAFPPRGHEEGTAPPETPVPEVDAETPSPDTPEPSETLQAEEVDVVLVEPAPEADALLVVLIGGGGLLGLSCIAVLVMCHIRRNGTPSFDDESAGGCYSPGKGRGSGSTERHVHWGGSDEPSLFAERLALLMQPLNDDDRKDSTELVASSALSFPTPVSSALVPVIKVEEPSCDSDGELDTGGCLVTLKMSFPLNVAL